MSRTRPGPADLALLHAGLHSHRLVLLKSLLDRAGRAGLGDCARERLAQHWELLERAESRRPAEVREALAYPAVGDWLAHALNTDVADPTHGAAGPQGEAGPYGDTVKPAPPATPAPPGAPDTPAPSGPSALAPSREPFEQALLRFGAVAVAVALHARTGFRITLPTDEGRLVLPGIGTYEAHAPRVRLVAGPRSLRLTPEGRRSGLLLTRPYSRAAGVGWRGLSTLPGSRARLDDSGPYRLRGRGGPVPRGGARARGGEGARGTPAGPWLTRWCSALALLESADPARAAEVASLTRALVPLDPSPGGVSSATLRAAPWAVLTGLPDSAPDMAEVLVHEIQHSKLAVLGDLAPLHHAGEEAVYRVAWRLDPRPFSGVLQGTYAHLALADLWDRIAERPGATPAARAAARGHREEYREQVAEALPILLESGQLTCTGREFAIGMERHLLSLGQRGVPLRRRQRYVTHG
ncbi:aKG-HExxH-type peptide beta-hydroxylase [Streptomyces daliensis]